MRRLSLAHPVPADRLTPTTTGRLTKYRRPAPTESHPKGMSNMVQLEDPPQAETELVLHTVSAGGFSATADAYAISAKHEYLWFLSMVGSQVALKAIAATIMKNPPEPCHIIRGIEGMELSGQYQTCHIPYHTIGTWTSRTTRLRNRAYHTLVYSKKAHHDFEGAEFVILPRTEQEAPILHHTYLDARSSIPLHHTWAQWLWQRGLASGEIAPLDTSGILAYYCLPKFDKLQEDITQAIIDWQISVPR